MWAYFCINSPVVEKKAETTVTSTPINHGCMMKAVQSVQQPAVRLCVARQGIRASRSARCLPWPCMPFHDAVGVSCYYPFFPPLRNVIILFSNDDLRVVSEVHSLSTNRQGMHIIENFNIFNYSCMSLPLAFGERMCVCCAGGMLVGRVEM